MHRSLKARLIASNDYSSRSPLSKFTHRRTPRRTNFCSKMGSKMGSMVSSTFSISSGRPSDTEASSAALKSWSLNCTARMPIGLPICNIQARACAHSREAKRCRCGTTIRIMSFGRAGGGRIVLVLTYYETLVLARHRSDHTSSFNHTQPTWPWGSMSRGVWPAREMRTPIWSEASSPGSPSVAHRSFSSSSTRNSSSCRYAPS